MLISDQEEGKYSKPFLQCTSLIMNVSAYKALFQLHFKANFSSLGVDGYRNEIEKDMGGRIKSPFPFHFWYHNHCNCFCICKNLYNFQYHHFNLYLFLQYALMVNCYSMLHYKTNLHDRRLLAVLCCIIKHKSI